MKIHAVDRQGKEHTLEGRDGWSVMEILRDGGLDIAAECGGACACATCHVYVNDGWYEKLPAPSEAEIDMLDMALAVEPNFAPVLPGHLQRSHRRHQGDRRAGVAAAQYPPRSFFISNSMEARSPMYERPGAIL